MAISSPNYTQFPNELLDQWQGRLELAEWAVLSYIVRHTFGWRDQKPFPITYKEFIHGVFKADGSRVDHGCGVKSSATLKRALARLMDLDLIEVIASLSDRGGVGPSAYRIKVEDKPPAASLPTAAVAGGGPGGGTSLTEVPQESGTSLTEVPALHSVKCHAPIGASLTEVPFLMKETITKETSEKETNGASDDAPLSLVPKEAQEETTAQEYTAQDYDEREVFLDEFNHLIRALVEDEEPRYKKEALEGVHKHGLDAMLGCLRAMATTEKFVEQSDVSPRSVMRRIVTWEDAGRPRQWVDVERYRRRKVQRQGG
jgi:hypothetical protein